jgi:hypothetical protein
VWQSHVEESEVPDADSSKSSTQSFLPGRPCHSTVSPIKGTAYHVTSIAQSPKPYPTWSAGTTPYQTYRVDASDVSEDDVGQDTDYTDLEENW